MFEGASLVYFVVLLLLEDIDLPLQTQGKCAGNFVVESTTYNLPRRYRDTPS